MQENVSAPTITKHSWARTPLVELPDSRRSRSFRALEAGRLIALMTGLRAASNILIVSNFSSMRTKSTSSHLFFTLILLVPKRHVRDCFGLRQPEVNAINRLLCEQKEALQFPRFAFTRLSLPLGGGGPQVIRQQLDQIALPILKSRIERFAIYYL